MRSTATSTERDYYEVLGVTREAGPDELRRAYRARARQLHPDLSDDPEAVAKFSQVAEAYEVLSKSRSRFLYDSFGFRGRGNGWFAGGAPRLSPEFVELLTFARRRRPRPIAQLELDSYDAARGAKRRVRFTKVERCPVCDGDGAASAATSTSCPACAGTGRRRQSSILPNARLLQIERCEDCAGRGRLISEPCFECGGEGEVSVGGEAEVRVPPGATDGQRVPLDSSDDFVIVRVRAEPRKARLVRYGAALSLFVAIVFFALTILR